MPIDNVADKLNAMWIVVFLLYIIFPGLVSMRVFRLLAPAKEVDWKDTLYESAFWGTINLLVAAVLFGAFYVIDYSLNLAAGCSIFQRCPLLVGLVLAFLFLVAVAVVSPFSWTRIREWNCFKQLLLAHHYSAWDFYFSQERTCFVLIHLKDGSLIGGYYGDNSFATHFPDPNSIYIERVIDVDAAGNFIAYAKHTAGALLYRDDFNHIEFFNDSTPFSEKKDANNKPTVIESESC